MPVVIRLARHGTRNRPYYRIVVTEKGNKRDGKFIERVGSYSTLTSPPKVVMKEDRVKTWIERGAKPSTMVRALIVKQIPGFVETREKHQLSMIQARRKKRKERIKRASK